MQESIETNMGIKAVLEQSLQSYEKLPMLEIIFEKFTRQLTTSLRNLTSEAVNVEISDLQSRRFEGYFQSHGDSPFTICVFRAVEWENFGLLLLENSVIFAFVDILLGGKNNINNNLQNFGRVLTSIEQGIAKQVCELLVYELSHAFEQITPNTMSVERMETNPNFVTISRPGDGVIVLRLSIDLDGEGRWAEILIPYKTIEPIKDKMQQMFLGDKFGTDHQWERALYSTIQDVDLTLQAVIKDTSSTVADIAKLKVGDTLLTNHNANQDITVEAKGVELFTGKIGKVEKNVAIDITEFLAE